MDDISTVAWQDATPNPNRQLCTTGQAADYLGVSQRTVKNLMASGQLHYVKIGRSTRLHLDDLDRFIAQHRRKQRHPRRRVS